MGRWYTDSVNPCRGGGHPDFDIEKHLHPVIFSEYFMLNFIMTVFFIGDCLWMVYVFA